MNADTGRKVDTTNVAASVAVSVSSLVSDGYSVVTGFNFASLLRGFYGRNGWEAPLTRQSTIVGISRFKNCPGNTESFGR